MKHRASVRAATGPSLAAAALLGGCFVDTGSDCAGQGVAAEPCVVSLAVGGSVTLRGEVLGNPDADVDWLANGVTFETAFQPSVEPDNDLLLIGKIGVGGSYTVRASDPDDTARFADVRITVTVPSYGYPPPPVQIDGADFPDDQVVACASGGGYDYIAYADPGGPAPTGSSPGPGATNFFVKQFRQSDGQLVVDVPGQFATFGTAPNAVAPNAAADCHGVGYWFDRPDLAQPIELRRLPPGGAVETYVMPANFTTAGPLVVACDGTIVFRAVVGAPSYFRIDAFGEDPVPFVGTGFAPDAYELIALGPEDRLYFADQGFGAAGAIVRSSLDGVLDAGFAFQEPADFCNVGALAVDGEDIVYVATTTAGCEGPDVLYVFNALGEPIDVVIDRYLYVCTGGCATTDCGTEVPFQNVVALAASEDGKLIVADDVFLGAVPPECAVGVRFVVLDP